MAAVVPGAAIIRLPPPPHTFTTITPPPITRVAHTPHTITPLPLLPHTTATESLTKAKYTEITTILAIEETENDIERGRGEREERGRGSEGLRMSTTDIAAMNQTRSTITIDLLSRANDTVVGVVPPPTTITTITPAHILVHMNINFCNFIANHALHLYYGFF